jgi:hypothetical protein
MPAHWQRPFYEPRYLATTCVAPDPVRDAWHPEWFAQYDAPEPANRLAVVALICGILPLPLFAIGFAAAGIRRASLIDRGLVMSVVGLVLGLIWVLLISGMLTLRFR